MVKVAAAEQDLHFSCAGGGGGIANANPTGFDPMEEEDRNGDKDMWLDRDQDGLFDVNDASIFYDDFPSLPDFPCTSSCSSSSSSTQPVPNPVTGNSSSSATSWADEDSTARMSFQQLQDELKMDAGRVGDVECVDVMENLEYMDLIDCNELWDPSSIFDPEENQQTVAQPPEEESGGLSFLQGNSELAMIFLEWLKQNKDCISAEDMRSIKLKRSTIESASKRLGSTKEGKKQLLKLILDWVEQYQLQKKAQSPSHPNPSFTYNPHPNTTQWMQPEVAPVHVYSGEPYSNQMHGMVNGIPCQHPQVMEHPPSWALPQLPPPPQSSHINRQQSLYGNPYTIHDPNGERVTRLGSSATKEARKKRMARQRRSLYSHHNRHSNQQQNQMNDPRPGDDGASPGDWEYWSPGASSPTAAAAQPNSTMQPQRQAAAAAVSDRLQQQGWKTEKNLKFLLQKVLKQSDVGNLGRIVLPKKEAESHLPELETRDGISIAMEDIGTSHVWNMRYRFWPNNKSRMYLLENTGDFVRVNGLQEGDFIVIYSDTKCGKYMIRGVKVRPGGKSEAKKPARRNIRNLSSLAGNSSPLAPIRQAAR
ncbi:acetolactate synthase [Salvia divinorum]|uniref:Acetolactate synthase n=1 Tax=Salvia divinorum TaxID=28513 RepID=A0ABD1G9D5_SALDI